MNNELCRENNNYYLIPWPGPHLTPLILIKDEPLLMAIQSSPINIHDKYIAKRRISSQFTSLRI